MFSALFLLSIFLVPSVAGNIQIICERTTESIECESGYHVHVTAAFYGRHDSSTCPYEHHSRTDCTKHVTSQVQRNCRNRRACRIRPSNDEYGGDPCRGTHKYLEVNYNCVHSPTSVKNVAHCFLKEMFAKNAVCSIEHCPTANLKCTSDATGTCSQCEDTYLWKLVDGNSHCAAKCSHERKWCWPGTCGGELSRNCACQSPAFTTVKDSKNGDFAKCTLVKKPTINTCQTSVQGKNGEVQRSEFMGSSACENQQDAFINFLPINITFDLQYDFGITINITRPIFIVNETFGIVGGQVKIEKQDKIGGRHDIGVQSLPSSKTSPVATESKNDTIQISNLNLTNGERLCVTYLAQGSGHFTPRDVPRSIDQAIQRYEVTETTREICFLMDTMKPRHCQQQGNCSYPSLQVNTRITKNPNITIQFQGWFDPRIDKGTRTFSSGIKSYEIAIHSVYGGSGPSDLLVNTSNIFSASYNHTATVRASLPSSGLFAIYLDVVDGSGEGNVRQARRFVLYDNDSSIEFNNKNIINVTSAVQINATFWQTGHKVVCFEWQNRFYNNRFKDDNLLKRIKQEVDHFDGVYEQTDSPLSVNGTQNINGIIEFEYTLRVKQGTVFGPVQRNVTTQQSLCFNETLLDGYRVDVNVSAKDIMNNTLVDNVAVHIDASPPDIRNIWLERDGQSNIYFHHSTDLTKMKLSFEVFDSHSGISELRWSFGEKDANIYHQISNGTIGANRLSQSNDCVNSSICYCPVVGVCEIFKYSIDMRKVTFEGLHNRPYLFSVYAKNGAGLFNMEHIDILIDSSAPVPGNVKEGPIDGPDIDFVDHNTVLLNWQGFIDHESGIQKYKVALAPTCLNKLDMINANASVPDTNWKFSTETYAVMPFPSAGKFFTSVIAYNNALEPSESSCSDGIIYDQTPIVITKFRGNLLRVDEGIACIDNTPWMITEDLKRVKLENTKECDTVCNNFTFPEFLSSLEILPVSKNDTAYSHAFCQLLPPFVNHVIYLPTDSLDFTWSYHDEFSQLRDFEIGFGSDVTDQTKPDIEDYKTNSGRNGYSKVHEGLTSESQFWIFIKSVNKANLVSILPIGPVVIDETPPVLAGRVHHFIDEDHIYVGWSNTTFVDPAYEVPVSQVLFQIRTNGKPVTPFLQNYNSPEECPIVGADTCLTYPVHRLHPQDTESGQFYYVSLHVYNKAGHFVSVKTDRFLLPSRRPPSVGTVFDINPEHKYDFSDVDFHESLNETCVKWNGFSHHRNVSFEVGLGSEVSSDNVISFTAAKGLNEHCIKTNNLVPFVKYFAIVRALCSGGTTVVSSDGFTVINTTEVAINTLLGDGKGCNKHNSLDYQTVNADNSYLNITIKKSLKAGKLYSVFMEKWMNVLTKEIILRLERQNSVLKIISFVPTTDVNHLSFLCRDNVTCNVTYIMQCEWDVDKQISKTEYQFHWEVPAIILKCSPYYQVAFLQMKHNKNLMIRGFTNAVFQERHNFMNLSLYEGNKYYAALKICFGKICTRSLYSKGVTLFDNSISTFNVTVTRFEKNGCTAVRLLLEMHSNDSEIGHLFQWTLSRKNDGTRALFAWGHLKERQIQVCLPEKERRGPVIFGCIRLVGTDSSITKCSQIVLEMEKKQTTRLLDVGKSNRHNPEMMQLRHVSHLGQTMKAFEEDELDYVTSKVTLGGITLGTEIDHIDFYLMRNQILPTNKEQCFSDPNCLTSVTSNDGYVFFDNLAPKDGDLFYVCCRANNTYRNREKTTETIPGFELCSDGVYVDDSRPIPGAVMVQRLNIGFITSADTVEVVWLKFSEDAPVFNNDVTSVIKSYELAVGSRPGSENVLTFTSYGQETLAVLTGLSFVNGETYYATVRGTNHANLSSVSMSEAFTVDIRPPVSGVIHIRGMTHGTTFIRKDSVPIYLHGFADNESGLEGFWISISSLEGEVVVQPTFFSNDDIQLTNSELSALTDGHSYQILCRAVNRAGLSTFVQSLAFKIDSSYPSEGTVYEGFVQNKDIDYQTGTTEIHVTWNNFFDAHSDIDRFLLSLGTKPLGNDISPFIDVGNNTGYSWKLNFMIGQKYYTTVRACNGAGLCTSATSNGVTIDNSPPIPGIVQVGEASSHRKYLSRRTSLSARWLGFEDPQSQIEHFEWCIGSSKTTCDILPFTFSALSNAIFKSGLMLPTLTRLYVKVKAFNNAGLSTESVSGDFQVDDSPPTLVVQPFFHSSVETSTSLTKSYHFDNSLLRIGWQFSDPESHVISTRISLTTHSDGRSPISELILGNENRTTIALNTTSRLMNGDHYTLSVTACNKAHLCTTGHSNNLIIDSTPPHIGGFKMPISWKEMKDENVSYIVIDLSWYGFIDPETSIKHYYVSGSKTFAGSELTNGFIKLPGNVSNAQIPLRLTIGTPVEIILSISASNYAGLQSKYFKATVEPLFKNKNKTEGILQMQRHSCKSHFCEGDCTCSVIGKLCRKQKCRPVGHDNSTDVTIKVGTFYNRSVSQVYSASSSCLSAHWEVSNKHSRFLRFEWSVGLETEAIGVGIFHSSEYPWNDVGSRNEMTYCLQHGKELKHGSSYVIYIRAWLSSSSYRIFTSDPVVVDNTPPSIRRKAAVIESIDRPCETDIRFASSFTKLCACWSNAFEELESRITKFEFMMGTARLADDVIQSKDVGLQTHYCPDHVTLYEGTKYYFSVRAYNDVGMHSTLSSNGFVVDDTKPFAGVVFNTDRHSNVRYQSHNNSLSSSWHGFEDEHSHIEKYEVSVIYTNKTIIRDFYSVGLLSSVNIKGLDLEMGSNYQILVRAVDAAGYKSDIVYSNVIKVDQSPPVGFECRNFEKFIDLEDVTTSNIGFNASLVKDSLYQLQVKIQNATSNLKGTVSISGTLIIIPILLQEENIATSNYIFLSPITGNILVSVELENGNKDIISNVSLCKCSSLINRPDGRAVHVQQIASDLLSVRIHVKDVESGISLVLVGAGTTPNGKQVQPFTAISEGHYYKLRVPVQHGTPVYVSVVAKNGAGLMSVFNADVVIIDHTPPIITDLAIDIEYIHSFNTTSVHLVGRFAAKDDESEIKHCLVAIGTAMGKTDVHLWRITQNFTSFSSLSFEAYHGMKLFASLKCVNDVEKISMIYSRYITVVLQEPNIESANIEFLADQPLTSIGVESGLSNLTVHWTGIQDVIEIQSYQCRLEDLAANTVVDWQDTGKYDYVTFADLELTDGHRYVASVKAVNAGGYASKTINASILVESRSPKLTGNQMTVTHGTGMLSLDWSDVFKVPPGLRAWYELSLGSRYGQIDILNQRILADSHHVIQEKPTSRSVYVVIQAILETGAFVHYNTIIRI